MNHKIFISQPMNGKTTEQIAGERRIIVNLVKSEHGEALDNVFPAFTGEGRGPVLYLAKSIELLASADGAIFMPGWENARGCRIEYEICREYGIPDVTRDYLG